MCKFRCGNSNIPYIISGRFKKINRIDRLCNLCDDGVVGDILKCKALCIEIKMYIQEIYINKPSIAVMHKLFNSCDVKIYRIWLNLLLLLMQSLHKFVCVLCILHIISRSLCIGCSLSIIIPCERWNENTNIVYCLLSIAPCRTIRRCIITWRVKPGEDNVANIGLHTPNH